MSSKLPWVILLSGNGQSCEHCHAEGPGGGYLEGICRATTAGLREMFDHPELEMVIDFDDRVIGYILNTLGLQIQNGATFHDGDFVDGVLVDVPVRINAIQGSRGDMLRVVLPDLQGRWPEDEACDYPFGLQMLQMAMLEAADPRA